MLFFRFSSVSPLFATSVGLSFTDTCLKLILVVRISSSLLDEVRLDSRFIPNSIEHIFEILQQYFSVLCEIHLPSHVCSNSQNSQELASWDCGSFYWAYSLLRDQGALLFPVNFASNVYAAVYTYFEVSVDTWNFDCGFARYSSLNFHNGGGPVLCYSLPFIDSLVVRPSGNFLL